MPGALLSCMAHVRYIVLGRRCSLYGRRLLASRRAMFTPSPTRSISATTTCTRSQADFTETYTGAGMTRTESGTLLLKKPGQMRWDYDQPRPKMFVTDGHTAWFYVPGEKQARRTPVKQLDDLRSPLRYLLGKTKLEKELDGLSLAPDRKAGECRRHRAARHSQGNARPGSTNSAGDRARRPDRAHCGGGTGRLGDRIPLSSAEGERRSTRSAISLCAAAGSGGGGGNGVDGVAVSIGCQLQRSRDRVAMLPARPLRSRRTELALRLSLNT